MVIRVHGAAHRDRLTEPLVAHVLTAVVRNVQLEEASMSLWESVFTQARDEPDLMPVGQVVQIHGQARPSPNELQVKLAFLLGEAVLEHLPEHFADSVLRTAAAVTGD